MKKGASQSSVTGESSPTIADCDSEVRMEPQDFICDAGVSRSSGHALHPLLEVYDKCLLTKEAILSMSRLATGMMVFKVASGEMMRPLLRPFALMYFQMAFTTSVRGRLFLPVKVAIAGDSVFGAKMPTPAFFIARAFAFPAAFFAVLILPPFTRGPFVVAFIVFVVFVVVAVVVAVVVVFVIAREVTWRSLEPLHEREHISLNSSELLLYLPISNVTATFFKFYQVF